MKDAAVDPIIKNFIRTQTDITIDRYSSKGGFGELYFGTRNVLGDRVALKFYALSEGHEEPILLKKITHENILPIYDAKVIDNKYAYYLTPEISGGDLQDIIEKYNISTDYCVKLIQGVLKALIELHKPPLNLVHRDLKTGNILIDENNDKPYLADFGTIKQIPDEKEFVSASKYSFLYRSPEVVKDNQYFKQSDIYQVGVILYQILGGDFPIDQPENWLKDRVLLKFNQLQHGDKTVFLFNYLEELIVKGKILDLESLPIFIPKKLKNIIKTATHTDLNKRFKTCAHFLKALYEYSTSSLEWWNEGDIIYAKNEKKAKYYRITKVKKEFISEYSKDKIKWRKLLAESKLQNHIDKIEVN